MPVAKTSESMPRYPLLSVELMHAELLASKLNDPARFGRIIRDLMLRLEGQLENQGAVVESVRENVMFFSFRNNEHPTQALSKALKIGMALAKKTIQLSDIQLQCRVGMDFVSHAERGPMTAVPERTIAESGQILVSETIYRITQKQLPYEAMGPIKVQEKMRTFYRILLENQATPKREAVSSSVNSNQAEPASAPQPVINQAKASSPDAAGKARVRQLDQFSPVDKTKIQRRFEAPEQPQNPVYQPPEFVSVQNTLKKGNIEYHQAIQSILGELEGMLTDDPKATGRVVLLCGEEGAGKSTIISLVRNQAPEDAFIWTGGSFYASSAPDRFPLGYWLEMVQNLLGLPNEGIPKEHGEEHIDNLLGSKFGEEFAKDRGTFIKTLLSVTSPEPISSDIRPSLGRMIPEFLNLFIAMAQIKPLVLVMENLECSDSASIELLLQLIQNDLLKHPVCILFTCTPNTLFTGALHQAISLLPWKEYVLKPASEETLISMAEPPLGVPWKKLPDTLRVQLVEKGSPMFLEEAFRWIHEQKGFSVNDKTGKLAPEKSINTLSVPEELLEIIRERFNRQEHVLRQVMQAASVLGERFSANVLLSLLSLLKLPQVVEHLEDILKFLWQNGFLVPDLGSMARFRHRLIWQVAYDSMESSTRRQLHQLAAQYLDNAQTRERCINPCLAAHHYETINDSKSAIAPWNQAGAWLANVGSVTGANMAFNRVKSLLESQHLQSNPLERRRLYESLGILNLDANPEYAKNLLLAALQLGGEGDDLAESLQLRLFLAQAYDRQGAYHRATSTLHQAAETLSGGENPLERAALSSQEIWYLYLQGSYEEALLVYQQDLLPNLGRMKQPPWEDPALRPVYFRGQLALARIALMQCNPMATDIINEALASCEVLGERVLAIHFRLTRNLGLLLKGDFAGCQREMEPLLEDIESLPYPAEVMTWWGLIVLMVHCETGDWQNAFMLLPNTSYQAEQARDYLAWCICHALAGRISAATGQHSEAQKLLEKAVTVAAEYHLAQPALMGWRFLAENELARRNLEVADQLCLRAIDVAQKPHIQNRYELYQLVITQARVLMGSNRLKEAGVLLEQHWPALVKTHYSPIIAEAAFQISELYRNLSLEVPEAHRSRYREKQESFLQKAALLWQEQGNTYRLSAVTKARSGAPVG